MRYRKLQPLKTPRGYIALIATIIISLVLLEMVVEESFSGWFARFAVLQDEKSAQARALADGCLDEALVALAANGSYAGSASMQLATGTATSCSIEPLAYSTPQPGEITITAQAAAQDAQAAVQAVILQGSGQVIFWKNIVPTAQ